jgi:hypothetical protein
MNWYDLILQILKSWPLAAVVLGLVFRGELRGLLLRLRELQLGEKFKMKLEAGAVPQPAALPTQPAAPAMTEAPATPSLPAAKSEDARPTEERPAAPPAEEKKATPDLWRRCGNVYWLGNNIMTVAVALLSGQMVAARRELENAKLHARALPLPSFVVERLQDIDTLDLDDPGERGLAANKLFALGVQVGRFVQAQQPDFAEIELKGAN